MNHQQKPNDQYDQGYDVGEFRYAAAALCRFLIRAREKKDPGFLSPEEYAAWNLEDIRSDSRPSSWLLQQAQRTILEINDKFMKRCGSGGLAYESNDPLNGFKSDVAFLVDHLYDLPRAIKSALKSEDVDLENLARWDTLPRIRATLDTLPHPKPKGANGLRLPMSDVCGSKSPWRVEHPKVYYNDKCIPASGIPLRVLRALVEARRPMTRPDLETAAWPDGSVVTPKTLDKHLSALRKILREALHLPEDSNPIPAENHGSDITWSLLELPIRGSSS